jgi:hypothetical protein
LQPDLSSVDFLVILISNKLGVVPYYFYYLRNHLVNEQRGIFGKRGDPRGEFG